MRLIDADALIDEIKHTLWDWDSVDGIKSSTVLKQTISDINNMPTVDAVEVVRCFDCKYLQCNMREDGILPFGVDEYECRHWCGSCDPMDFCSYGERREDVKVN